MIREAMVEVKEVNKMKGGRKEGDKNGEWEDKEEKEVYRGEKSKVMVRMSERGNSQLKCSTSLDVVATSWGNTEMKKGSILWWKAV